MKRTKKMALAGMLCALAVVVMLLGGVIPLATFVCPAVAGLMLIPIFVECGEKFCYGAYVAVAALALILCADKEAALVFAFLGYYPALRWRIEQIRSMALRVIVRLAVFNISIGIMYALIIWVFQMQAIINEMQEMGVILNAVMLLIGNVTLLMYDRVLKVFTSIYIHKLRDKLIK